MTTFIAGENIFSGDHVQVDEKTGLLRRAAPPSKPERKPAPAMVPVVCENQNCKKSFNARAADRKRGWGRFCCKSCSKA